MDADLPTQRVIFARRSTAEATTEYFDDQDLFGQWLEEECIVEQGNEHRWATVAELFDNWSLHARRAGEEPGSKKRFGESMLRRGFERSVKKISGKTQKVYLGIELNTPQMREP